MTSIESAAWQLAMAEQALSAAEEVHRQRQSECAVIEGRLAEAEAKCNDIRARARSGELSEEKAGGLFSLSQADLSDLEHLCAEAHRALKEAEPTKQRNELAAAQNMLQRTKDQAELEALKGRAVEIDSALIQTLKGIGEVNRRLTGRPSIGGSWGASPQLREAIAFGKTPA